MSKRFLYTIECLAFMLTLVSVVSGCQPATLVPPPPTVTPVPPALTAAPSPKASAALEEGTRAPSWTFTSQGEVWSSPTFANGLVYIGSAYYGSPLFYAVDAQTGQEKWRLPTGKTLEENSTINGVVSSPAVADRLVFFGGLDGKLHAVSK